MLPRRLLTLTALVLLPIACSSGSSGTAQLSISQLGGNWNVTITPRTTTCPPLEAAETVAATIAISGSTATISVTGDPDFTLPVVNGRVVGTRTGNVSEVQDFDFGPTGADTFGGSVTTRYAGPGGTSTCTDVDDISGTRVVINTQASNWNGTWNATATILPNSCGIPTISESTEFTISISGSTATLVQPVPNTSQAITITLQVVNNRLVGEANGGTYDWGLTGTNTISGTTSASFTVSGQSCTYVQDIQATRV